MSKLRTVLLFPGLLLDSFKLKNQSQEERYFKIQKWCQRIIKSLGFTLEISYEEEVCGPVYLMSNHQSTFDPVMIVASFDQPMTFVSKIENKKIPLVSQYAQLLKVIFFDRDSREGNIAMLREVLSFLNNNYSVLIFPEGTRSKSKQMNPLKNGSVQPAKLAKTPILPVTLVNSYLFDSNPNKEKVLKIHYGKLIQPELFKTNNLDEITKLVEQEIKSHL